MTRNKKLIIALFVVVVLLAVIWLSLDSRTKNSLYRATLCKLIYGKNICNFYEMMDIMGYRHPDEADFNKAMQLCRDMEDVPKKDSCFEYIAQVVSFYDSDKAREACDEIKEIRDQAGNIVHIKDSCYGKIPCAVCINGCDTCPEGCEECLIGIEKKLKDPNMKWYYSPERP